jgi:hypothetical protein
MSWVDGGLAFDVALGIGEHFERFADDRPALVARNMLQRIALRRRETTLSIDIPSLRLGRYRIAVLDK